MSPFKNFPWKNTFLQENFSIDYCLSKLTQKANLNTLKSFLKNYGDELHRQMAEILKTETEAIANLAEYLTNINTNIDDLSVSLSQLQEELKILHTLIENAEIEYRKTLDSKRMKEIERNQLLARLDFITITLYVDDIIKSVEKDPDGNTNDLEKAVHKFSFQKNYLSELGIVEVSYVIMKTENKLLSLVHQQFLKGLGDKNEITITKCLDMYNNLDKQKEAEELYQIKIVRPVLSPIYTERCLDKFDQDVNKIYNKTLEFLNSDMKLLDDILQRNSHLKTSFNFILNSFWVEVDMQCRKGLPHITAPGNPELFQKRFVSTWNLVIDIAKKCGNENFIKTQPSIREHIRRFNLPVYFEIRFQQIASQFESDLMIEPDQSSILIGQNDFGFQLKITLDLYVALKKCFDEHVFINQLADHFLKFSMFLLSRYIMWFDKILQKSGSWENLIMSSLVDMKCLQKLLGDKENLKSPQNIYAIFPEKMEAVIVKVFESNRQILSQFSMNLNNHLIASKVRECSEQLQNVTAIPRLFRRTNRKPPKKASTYMIEAIKPIIDLHEKYKNADSDIMEPLLNNIIPRVTNSYSTLVHDVLQSVCKTEESLRRLKSRNIPSNDDTQCPSSEIVTDEMKIREQIKLDINYFTNMLRKIGAPNSNEALTKLGEHLS